MRHPRVEQQLEAFSEALVFAESDDALVSGSLRSQLGEIRQTMDAQDQGVASVLLARAGRMLSRDTPTAEQFDAGCDALSRMVTCLLRVYGDATAMSNPIPPEQVEVPGEIAKVLDHLKMAESHLVTLESEPEDEGALEALAHTFESIARYANSDEHGDLESVSRKAGELVERAFDGTAELGDDAIDALFETIDALRVQLAEASGYALADAPNVPTLLIQIQSAMTGRSRHATVAVTRGASRATPIGNILVMRGAANAEHINEALRAQQGPARRLRLGELLVEACIATEGQVNTALEYQETHPRAGRLGEVLGGVANVPRNEVSKALAKQKAEPRKRKLGEILVLAGHAEAQDVARTLREQKALRERAV